MICWNFECSFLVVQILQNNTKGIDKKNNPIHSAFFTSYRGVVATTLTQNANAQAYF